MTTFVGTSGNDTIVGTIDNDVIIGGKGNDRIFAGKGDDFVNGGDGANYVEGGDGNDTIYAGIGRDSIFGGSGSDELYSGGGGIDYLSGGTGSDRFIIQASDGDTGITETFYNGAVVDQWVRIGDLKFGESDKVILSDGDASDGFLNGFVEVDAAGVTNSRLDSFDEWKMLGQYLLNQGDVYQNTQQGSLSYILSDAQNQTHVVEFYGYSLNDLL